MALSTVSQITYYKPDDHPLISAIRSIVNDYCQTHRGHEALAVAMLDVALTDLFIHHAYGRQYQFGGQNSGAAADSARRWLLQPKSNYAFSFYNICNILQIDAELIMGAIRREGWL